MARLNSFRELRVYQELRRLHLAAHEESLQFPKFELYELDAAYEACDKMLARLHERLGEWRGTTRIGYEVRENASRCDAYGPASEWKALVELTADVMDEFASTLHLPPSTLHP